MSTLETNSIGKYSGNNVSIDDALNLKSYDTAGRDALTSVAGDMIYNSTDSKVQVYTGSAWEDLGGIAAFSLEYLVVGGGGRPDNRTTANLYSGGGGAGGLLTNVSGSNSGGGNSASPAYYAVTGTNYKVEIAAAAGESYFDSITAGPGGSGGTGASAANAAACTRGGDNTATGPTNTFANQGYRGGNGHSPQKNGAGGGGGAGAVGSNATFDNGADGGVGVTNTILTSTEATTASVGEVISTDVYYAGGGGGAGYSTGGDGGNGGGGNAGNAVSNNAGTAGTANTGGGGGGAYNNTSGAGGSGVVILRYPDDYTITVGAGLTSSTITQGSNKVTIFTAGVDTVSWS